MPCYYINTVLLFTLLYGTCVGVAGDLMICRLSRPHGSVRGGDELFLLCSSVKKGAFFLD